MKTSNAAASEAMAAEASETIKQKLVYVGPTIIKIQAIKNRIYVGDLPKTMTEAIEKNKWLGNLFVQLDTVAEAQRSIRKKSGAYYEAYKLAQDLVESMN